MIRIPFAQHRRAVIDEHLDNVELLQLALFGFVLVLVATFGRNGRNAGEFHWVHNLAVDSKGNLYTTETYEGKRIQKFVYKGIGPVRAGDQGVLWPRSSGR